MSILLDDNMCVAMEMVVVGGWQLGTHLQGPHQSVCWLRPKRARHFLGEPGSEHNARHAQNKKEEKQKQKTARRRKSRGVKGDTRQGRETQREDHSSSEKASSQTVSRRLQQNTSSCQSIQPRHKLKKQGRHPEIRQLKATQ